MKVLCNVSHTYNCIQGLCKYPKPSNSLKLLFHFLKSTLKGTLSSLLSHETHNECQNYFCSVLRKKILSSLSTSIPYMETTLLTDLKSPGPSSPTKRVALKYCKSAFSSCRFSSCLRVTSDTTQLFKHLIKLL